MTKMKSEAQKRIEEAEAAGLTTLPIELSDEVLAMLDERKLHKDESYNDVLRRVFNLPKK